MSLSLSSPLVSPQWLESHLKDTDLRIYDCSLVMQPQADGSFGFGPVHADFAAGHIPGSMFINPAAQLSDLSHPLPLMMLPPEQMGRIMQSLGLGNDSTVILYDRGNHAWAARVWWMLRTCGFDNAAVLNGGFQRWVAEGREQESKITRYPAAATLNLQPRPNLMASKEEVLAAISDENTLLLHSLSMPMFTGEVCPYKRAGRITSSQNLFCDALVNPETNAYFEPEVLRTLVADTDALSVNKTITYCGGGIAASSTALALTLLGAENVAVYDGSLNEWTQDPTLPMETG